MQSTRLSAKECEVCGGHVRPLDDQSVFAYCENCGLVYALRDRLKDARDTETPGRLRARVTGESSGTDGPGGVPMVEVSTPAQPPSSYWRCPDCDTEIRSDNDSDLEFAKREHNREYHPNRPTG